MDIIDSKFEEATKGIRESWLRLASLDLFNYILSLREDLKIVYCVVVLDNQIFNGGLHQYFANGYGQFASYTVEALIKIGAQTKANILKEAYHIVNGENDTNEAFALKLLDFNIPALFKNDTLYNILSELDNDYEDVQQEDIKALLEKFLEIYNNELPQ